jgi:hypothetical protein
MTQPPIRITNFRITNFRATVTHRFSTLAQPFFPAVEKPVSSRWIVAGKAVQGPAAGD